ncbi:hypothetical protein [Citrobacter koseri]|uniref:hypothetical protein n=1 Tax=Citrobacter koseri TaxID=545 RepID=UPI000E06C879|nr:hypothetical protein [Citrobacter koseri]STB73294.1 Uncharacterised protein [Citrobacter koseri]STT23473.1 Uncharacterised protein [Citrobacter koseri]
MNARVLWVGSLTDHPGLRGLSPGNASAEVRALLIVVGVCLLLWGLLLLRAARMRGGDGRSWCAFREWGVPVTLTLGALGLVCVSDGGEVDLFLTRMHWCLLVRLQVFTLPVGDATLSYAIPLYAPGDNR